VAGQCLDKLPHSCGSKRGLQVFAGEDGNVNGYCFSCGTFVPNPYGEARTNESLPTPHVKTEEEVKEELYEVATYPSLTIESRKLRSDVLEHFGVKTSVDERDGRTPTAAYYPYYINGKLVGYKIKSLDGKKSFYSIGTLKNVDLFGWELAKKSGAKRLIIVEGEDDALALTKIIERKTKEAYRDYMPAVVSLAHGSGSAKRDLTRVKNDINKMFREIVICFDNDEAGEKATKEAKLVFPNAKVAVLPCKDAQECLAQGHQSAAFNAITFKIEEIKNTKLVYASNLHEEARKAPTWGDLTWPWDHLNQTTRGIRYGETIYVGAGVKMGKSEFVNALAAHFIKEHGIKVFLAKPEESNVKSYKLLAGKIVGRVFHDPKREFDYEAYDRAGAILEDRVAMVNLYQHLGWETLKSDIISAVEWGAKAIFIDPITNLTNGENAGDANSKLQEVAQELASMAMDYNIVIFIFCHLKAPEGMITQEKRENLYHDGKYIGIGNCAHEAGGIIYSNQFAGSRAMMRSCNLMIGIEGNKDDALSDEQRNVRHLKLLEDREFGETGTFPVYWDRNTTLFKEC
jgi:twinkle protein